MTKKSREAFKSGMCWFELEVVGKKFKQFGVTDEISRVHVRAHNAHECE